ncbi:MAG: IS630 family transposase [Candidatus Eisenbacteria bacterium]|uniref:IS630 family transposase n=1 Tax=Eiseniibacteriota bacterium TaxID=2212470 RepID=A0A956NI63_UNCEI|nr:IS630 family transposase [Candidatus Eisenbacteria bacterium]MCB9648382.1 IS630 family transposase [Deltaproteobacteria bacterium]
MHVKYIVELSETERSELEDFVRSGSKLVRKVKRAQILLAANEGYLDKDIAGLLSTSTSTIYRVKQRLVEGGVERALNDESRPGGSRKLSGKDEALLVAVACSDPPSGRAHWTLELLADAFVRISKHASLSRETVRRRLKEKSLKPWLEKMWCIPNVDAEFVARMEDVLELYEEQPADDEPVISFDESPVQLIAETRTPVRAVPGKPGRLDYEYRRNGTANLFLFLDAHRPWRHVKVTEHRTCSDFAECMRDLVDLHFPHARRIHVVLDNLSTHSAAALYRTFPAPEARRILRKLHFHFVPKHASWLNMVEIEIGVLKGQCLSRRIADRNTLERETAAWAAQRNDSGAWVKWLFTVEKARRKMGRSYPDPEAAERAEAA